MTLQFWSILVKMRNSACNNCFACRNISVLLQEHLLGVSSVWCGAEFKVAPSAGCQVWFSERRVFWWLRADRRTVCEQCEASLIWGKASLPNLLCLFFVIIFVFSFHSVVDFGEFRDRRVSACHSWRCAWMTLFGFNQNLFLKMSTKNCEVLKEIT